jgi:hypothetical protein
MRVQLRDTAIQRAKGVATAPLGPGGSRNLAHAFFPEGAKGQFWRARMDGSFGSERNNERH